MNDSVDLSVALDMLNRRITELNIKIVNGDTSEETKKKLNQILKLKQKSVWPKLQNNHFASILLKIVLHFLK